MTDQWVPTGQRTTHINQHLSELSMKHWTWSVVQTMGAFWSFTISSQQTDLIRSDKPCSSGLRPQAQLISPQKQFSLSVFSSARISWLIKAPATPLMASSNLSSQFLSTTPHLLRLPPAFPTPRPPRPSLPPLRRPPLTEPSPARTVHAASPTPRR